MQYKIDEKELIIDGMKEDRRIAVEEIREEYYISKDKIKEKIQQYKCYEGLEMYEKYNYKEIVLVLQQLLEEK